MQAHDRATQEVLQGAASDIYGRLLLILDSADREVLLMIMEGSACIWTGSGFVSAARAVSELPEDLTPWLYPIPSCLEPYSAMLSCLGV